MDYEKAYKAVLQTAIQWIKDGCTDKEKICLKCVFPELREGEDERIRQEIVEKISNLACGCFISQEQKQRFIHYLEKQKEQKPEEWDELQAEFRNINEAFEGGKKEVVAHPERYGLCKPAEWSKNDTVFLNEITDFFENKTTRLQHDIDMYAHWLKSLPERFNLQPRQEWSEDDEKMLSDLRNTLGCLMNTGAITFKTKKKFSNWLKSLRPSWKPSEEQMKVLYGILVGCRGTWGKDTVTTMESLYQDLKKLM